MTGLIKASALSASLILSAAATAQVIPQGDAGVELQTIASGLVSPILVTHAGDNSGRLFIVDQTGKILIWQNGQVLATPFLDISSLLVTLNTAYDERGLLGLAFHPNYANNGRFFVRYSVPRVGTVADPCFGTPFGCHSEVLAEFHVSADPNIANPTPTVLMTISKPQFNHNSGGLAFGPDGFLYFGMGDGGGANDGLTDNPPSHGPGGNGQNVNVALGKLHRIDVSTAGVFAIPPTNPFAAGGGFPSIFAYGFRNPFRFSFDDAPGGNGTLYLADVGQDNVEELDIVVNGGNYGWVIKEGTTCFNPAATTTPLTTCNDAGMIDPIAQYFHNVGIAIIGGFLYRNATIPALTGKYVFGDFTTGFAVPDGHLFYTTPVNGSNASQILRLRIGPAATPRNLGKFLKGIGRDQNGDLYICGSTDLGPTGANGVIYKLIPIGCGSADFNGDGDIGTDADIEAFFACLAGSCCPTCDPRGSDFNGDGDFGTDADIEAFFNVLAGRPCS
jgi:glucose/arabinose dehydrogenase